MNSGAKIDSATFQQEKHRPFHETTGSDHMFLVSLSRRVWPQREVEPLNWPLLNLL